MGSHHTKKAVNLHHDQVNAAHERRRLRQHEMAVRQKNYEQRRREARWKYLFIMSLAVSVWAGWQMTIVTGTYFVLKFIYAG